MVTVAWARVTAAIALVIAVVLPVDPDPDPVREPLPLLPDDLLADAELDDVRAVVAAAAVVLLALADADALAAAATLVWSFSMETSSWAIDASADSTAACSGAVAMVARDWPAVTFVPGITRRLVTKPDVGKAAVTLLTWAKVPLRLRVDDTLAVDGRAVRYWAEAVPLVKPR